MTNKWNKVEDELPEAHEFYGDNTKGNPYIVKVRNVEGLHVGYYVNWANRDNSDEWMITGFAGNWVVEAWFEIPEYDN